MFLDKDYSCVETTENGKKVVKPCYLCAHCNTLVILNPRRARPRERCLKCNRLICEERPVCRQECLPQDSIMLNNDLSVIGQRAGAVLDGARTSEEVDKILGGRHGDL